ncbi:MAG: peptidase, partial [Acidobacteria bacterium]|nr:peptidase [Acidobacteriota bacterium]
RTLVFLARLQNDGWTDAPRAIAVDRDTAVLVEPSGRATVVGQNTAYFIRPTAKTDAVAAGRPLTMRAIDVYRADAATTFDLPAWRGDGGLAYRLDVVDGVITSSTGRLY